MRYSCEMASRHETTCSRIAGRIVCRRSEKVHGKVLCTSLYISMSTLSSCERRTRFVPTRMRNSRRSFSRLSRSLDGPYVTVYHLVRMKSLHQHLILHAHPQFIHLSKVEEYEVDRVVDDTVTVISIPVSTLVDVIDNSLVYSGSARASGNSPRVHCRR